MTPEQFKEELTDLLSWLNETENIINSNLRPADEEYLEDLLEKVKVSHSEVKVIQAICMVLMSTFAFTPYKLANGNGNRIMPLEINCLLFYLILF